MITFKLSFLLAFPISFNKLSTHSVEFKLQRNSSKNLNSGLPALIGCAHISYELVPGKCKNDIDVVCWSSVSKIFTKEAQVTMKTVVRDGKAWVPFSIDHNFGHLKLDELKKLRDYVVQINIRSNDAFGRNIPTPSCDIESGSRFFEIIEDATNINAFESRFDSLENYCRNLVMRCSNFTRNELVTWLHSPEEYRWFNEIMDIECNQKTYHCRQFLVPSSFPSVSINKNIRQSNSKAQTKIMPVKVSTDVNISVPAEVFFTDPNLSIFRHDSSTGIVSKVFLLIVVESLMTKSQKMVLNSLVVKVKNLENIPTESLMKYGVHSIFFTYEIPNMLYYKSPAKPLAETIEFYENHIYFSDDVPKLKMFEFFQSQRFFIELYANRNEIEEKANCRLFGEEPNDHLISKIRNNYEESSLVFPNPILFAVVAYDISSLLENVWDFRESGQCHIPNLSLFQKPFSHTDLLMYTDIKTANEVNLSPSNYSKYPIILEESTLLFLGTSLTVELYLMAPQAASLIVHQIPDTFQRLLIIFREKEFAQTFYSEIADHNNKILKEITNDPGRKSLELLDIITGFFLDNGNEFAFFAEGLSNGFILNAWHIVDRCTRNQAKVFYNTDLAFEKRLYDQFLGEGLFSVTLKIPLHDILAKHHLYVKKRVPVPCMEALKKFSVLFHASNFKSILQQNILPSPRELMSLDLEWGVPLRWKHYRMVPIQSMLFESET